MPSTNRRTVLKAGFAGAAALMTGGTLAQGAPGDGVSRQAWGKREAMLPGYKSVAMRDVVYQPGAKTSNPKMPNDMVCHVPEGELHIRQTDGHSFVAKKGDVWTCRKGIGEDLENTGSTVAIMRIIDLVA